MHSQVGPQGQVARLDIQKIIGITLGTCSSLDKRNLEASDKGLTSSYCHI